MGAKKRLQEHQGWIKGLTGWSIGEKGSSAWSKDAASLYSKLEQTILPTFVMNGIVSSMSCVTPSHSMVLLQYSSSGPAIRFDCLFSMIVWVPVPIVYVCPVDKEVGLMGDKVCNLQGKGV